MTWLYKWLDKYVGSWLGTTEPEPPGSMRADLRGSGNLSANLTSSAIPQELSEDLIGIGWAERSKRIRQDDEQVLQLIFKCAVRVLK